VGEVEVEYVSAPREYEDLLEPQPSSTGMNGFAAAGSSRPTGWSLLAAFSERGLIN